MYTADLSSKTKLKDKTAILRELKQKTSFTLKREDYEYILSRIKDANSVLHDLTGQNCGLEPSRKHRSQTRLIKLIRGLTSSICNGLRRATTCSCAESHNVCLGLEHRNAVLVPSDSEEQVAKRFDFHLLMAREARIGQQADDDFSWESMQAKLTDNIAPRPLSISTNTSPPALPSNPSRVSRGVRWSRTLSTMLNKETSASPDTQFGTVSATQTLVQSSRALVIQGSVSSTAYTPGNLSDICRVVLKKGGKNRAMGCYGYITDQERKFELRPLPDLSEGRSTITLRELLSSRQNTGLPPFGYPDKLRVAEALSISILHLYSTPWLPKIVTLDDILFIRGGGTQSPDTEYSYRPFLTRSLQNEQRCSNPSTLTLSRPVNLTVLSLGALLIQVIIGRVVDDLDMSKAVITMDSILSKHEVGTKFSDEIITNGGINYAAAVRWCLGTVLEVSGLESDEFCQKFYGAVVAKLEEDIRTSSWGTA